MSGDAAGHEVVLRPDGAGAILRIVLGAAQGPDSVRAALALGFSSALGFEAGLACEDDGDGDGRRLLLTRWLDTLPDGAALDAARPALLEQRDAWRALLPDPGGAPETQRQARASQELRQQQRLRSLFARTTP